MYRKLSKVEKGNRPKINDDFPSIPKALRAKTRSSRENFRVNNEYYRRFDEVAGILTKGNINDNLPQVKVRGYMW